MLLILGTTVWAQTNNVRKNVRQGNRQYSKEKYDEAETRYRKALSYDSTYYKSQYNLGNAMYRQKNYSEAAGYYEKALQNTNLSKSQRAQAYHNMGNSHLQAGLQDTQNGMQQFQKAVNSYQEALKLDPKNNDTRYNYSYAKKLLQQAQQQQQQNGQNQDQQNKDQQNQDQQNQQSQDQQNKDQQQQQNQQQQSQGQQGQDKQQSQDRKQDQKKEDAERLLEAVKNNEKNTMKEHQKQIKVGQATRIEKDW